MAPVDPAHLERYFTVRHLWEEGKTAALTSADRQLLRLGGEGYRDPFFEEICEVAAREVSSTQLNAVIQLALGAPKRAFATYLLPEAYDILDHVSEPQNRDRSGTIVPNAGSTLNSTLDTTPSETQVRENTGNNRMKATTKSGRGKHLFVDGSDPICAVILRPKSLRASGVAPVHSGVATPSDVS